MTRTLMFVYGTLLRGERNHALLERATFVREASTRPEFELLDLGEHPAMIRGEAIVRGELWSVDATTLAALEELEGAPDYYHRIALVLSDGTEAECYVPTAPPTGGRRIPGGSWRRRVP